MYRVVHLSKPNEDNDFNSSNHIYDTSLFEYLSKFDTLKLKALNLIVCRNCKLEVR